MTSSLRNAVKRTTHKERAQPSERKRLGLLEKHKDYKLRAKDYHRKEDAIKVLRNKAALRNPDEFYFAMEKARTKDGVHLARSTQQKTHSAEEMRLMKTQDSGYVQLKAQAEAKKVERLAAVLHSVDAQPVSRRTVFAESGGEALAVASSAKAAAAAAPEGGKRPASAKRAHRELSQRKERLVKLRRVGLGLEAQKAGAGRGRKRKLGESREEGQAPVPVYKFASQRKR